MEQTLENTPFNHLSFTASHNSYDKEEGDIINQISEGCRGIEYDINQSDDGLLWSVNHNAGHESAPQNQFSIYLSKLIDWHNKHQDHDPIVIYMDLKHVTDKEKIVHVETYVKNSFSDVLNIFFQPIDLMGACDNLYDGAIVNGWPTLAELRNKFIFVFSGNPEARKLYANTNPEERLFFADKDLEGDGELFPWDDDKTRVFVNLRNFNKKMVREQVYNNAAIFRCYPEVAALDSAQEGLVKGAFECGINIISTDKYTESWAKIEGDVKYIKRKSLGKVSQEEAYWMASEYDNTKVADLKNGGKSDGTPVGDWGRDHKFNQLWYEGNNRLWNKGSGTVLDLDNGDENLQCWTNVSNEKNQNWRLRPITVACLSASIYEGKFWRIIPGLTPGKNSTSFTLESLSEADLDNLPEKARENNLYLIKNFENNYLGFESNGETEHLKLFSSKNELTRLCFLRRNSNHIVSIKIFNSSIEKGITKYIGLNKHEGIIFSDKITKDEILELAVAPGEPDKYIISNRDTRYLIANIDCAKYVYYNEGSLKGKSDLKTQDVKFLWKKIYSGVSIGEKQ